jgi:transcriptional regulator with XRE-family HTH domain
MPPMTDLARWLGEAMKKKNLNLMAVATAIGVDMGTVSRIRLGKQVPQPLVLDALAKLLDLDPDEAKRRRALQVGSGPQSLMSFVPRQSRSPRAVQEIPVAELSASAGPMTDVIEEGEPFTRVPGMLFRIRIAGDSMMPDWKSGELVEFLSLTKNSPDIAAGNDYFVESMEGLATFKRLQRIERHGLTFWAINRKKFPATVRLALHEIACIGLAMGAFIPRKT